MRKACVFGAAVCMLAIVLASAGYCQLPVKKVLTPTPGSRPSLYSPAIQYGETLYISGTGDGRPGSPDENYEIKTKRCLESIRGKLKLAGLDLENVVQTWVMFEDIDKTAEVITAYRELFPNNPPAGTMFGAVEIPGPSQIEITAIGSSAKRTILGQQGEDIFSQGVLTGNTVYISGQNSRNEKGRLAGTFEEQVRQSMKKVEATLKEAGLDFRHVVWTNIYMDNYDNYGIVNKVYSEFVDFGNEPARLTVFIDTFPDNTHVKIGCIATTDLSGRKVVRPANMTYGPDEMTVTASPAVWAGNTLYMSYQTGNVPGYEIDTWDLETQFRRMARNHLDVLQAAGLTTSDIVWAHVFLRDIEDYYPMNSIYPEYFHSPPPVRTCFQPNAGYEKNMVRLKSTFIAVKSRKE